MATGNNTWPEGWQALASLDPKPGDVQMVAIYGREGVNHCALLTANHQPVSQPGHCSLDAFQQWHKATRIPVHEFHVVDEAAWFPAGWVDQANDWMSPLGDGPWSRQLIDDGMELIHQTAIAPDTSMPLMASNANRWLKAKQGNAVQVYRHGNYLEVAVIEDGKITMHNHNHASSSHDVAYLIMLAYDQCTLAPESIPMRWEGDPDLATWTVLEQFVHQVQRDGSDAWQAYKVMLNQA